MLRFDQMAPKVVDNSGGHRRLQTWDAALMREPGLKRFPLGLRAETRGSFRGR